MKLLPGDLVLLPDGSEAMVNSAHYWNGDRQGFSAMGLPIPDDGGPLYYADECRLIHRHEYKPHGPIRRCECGAIYTTLADMMQKPTSPTH